MTRRGRVRAAPGPFPQKGQIPPPGEKKALESYDSEAFYCFSPLIAIQIYSRLVGFDSSISNADILSDIFSRKINSSIFISKNVRRT